MLSVSAISEILIRPKRLVAAMSWVKKLNRESGAWYEFTSALEFEDDLLESPEGLIVRGQWKQSEGDKPSNFGFGLHVGNDRIYAIDVKLVGRHKNTAGTGRPLFSKIISGIHEHTWSADGYGYAEPLENMLIDAAWNLFVKNAMINSDTFKHPDNGEPELPI